MPPIRMNATASIMPMAHAVANWSAVIISLIKRNETLSTADSRRSLRGSAGR